METRIIRLPEVIHRTGLSKATIYRMIKSGRFPPALRLGKRATGWRKDAIDHFIATRERADNTLGGSR